MLGCNGLKNQIAKLSLQSSSLVNISMLMLLIMMYMYYHLSQKGLKSKVDSTISMADCQSSLLQVVRWSDYVSLSEALFFSVFGWFLTTVIDPFQRLIVQHHQRSLYCSLPWVHHYQQGSVVLFLKVATSSAFAASQLSQ